ncbi:MAG: hypothetical protein Q9195_006561 [Heterodermia aff. obscurata]
MTSASSTQLLDLSQVIASASLLLTKAQLQEQNSSPTIHDRALLDGPNESADNALPAPGPSAKEVLDAKADLVQAASDLSLLVLGPATYLTALAYSVSRVPTRYHDITALSVVLEFNIHTAIPLHGDISFSSLSHIVGFNATRLERILRLLFVRKVFSESRPGYVAHTPVSRQLVQNPDLAAFLGHCTGEAFPSAAALTSTLKAHPFSELPSNAPFNLAFATSDPLFTFLTKNPTRFDRFNLGMAGISQAAGRSAAQVVEGYDWARLGTGATVVDVGGGNGHISIALAEAYPSLKLVVQDLPDAVNAGKLSLPSSLASRVEFQAHDMFNVNPVQGAEVYYLRHILHDWPDSHAILILRALVPALRPGSKVLVSDSVIPPAGVLHPQDEKWVRYLDMQMMVLHNARERTEEDFANLFQQADKRLVLEKVWRKGESAAASTMVEAQFLGI